jgi:hypothetical protein
VSDDEGENAEEEEEEEEQEEEENVLNAPGPSGIRIQQNFGQFQSGSGNLGRGLQGPFSIPGPMTQNRGSFHASGHIGNIRQQDVGQYKSDRNRRGNVLHDPFSIPGQMSSQGRGKIRVSSSIRAPGDNPSRQGSRGRVVQGPFSIPGSSLTQGRGTSNVPAPGIDRRQQNVNQYQSARGRGGNVLQGPINTTGQTSQGRGSFQQTSQGRGSFHAPSTNGEGRRTDGNQFPVVRGGRGSRHLFRK